ncbi:Increased recombination centers protein 22 [Paramarasmius palmivorus]|uniref:Increased recombination centers protein 22 n=1 Tax=Paramarasmius palmivorus TaxID=297713 RepID=A0AAW0D179_9AGAR
MRLGIFATLFSVVALVFAQEEGETERVVETNPEFAVAATAQWPDNNPFGHVVNGERNTLSVLVENKSNKNVTLLTVGGSILQPETDKLIRNLTTLTYGIDLLEGVKLQLPYSFYSEFKTGDLRLNLWLEHLTDNEKYRVEVLNSIVTIVEPEGSWFDIKLFITYLITAAFIGGLGYVAYLSFAPQPKLKPKKSKISEPVEVTATGAGGYQEEWIPEHHIKKAKKAPGSKATSGDELSGGETSGAESSGKKIRKRK